MKDMAFAIYQQSSDMINYDRLTVNIESYGTRILPTNIYENSPFYGSLINNIKVSKGNVFITGSAAASITAGLISMPAIKTYRSYR